MTTTTASSPLIAVFDVGKTNAKIALVDPALGQEIWSARRANAVVQGAATRELDLAAIESWLLDALRSAPHRERVTAIVPIAHGAAAVLVDHAGEVLAAPDYEDTRFDEVSEAYRPLSVSRPSGAAESNKRAMWESSSRGDSSISCSTARATPK